MDRDASTSARIEQHRTASESGDIDTEHAIYADDAIVDDPQSGEHFRGRPFPASASRAALAKQIPDRER